MKKVVVIGLVAIAIIAVILLGYLLLSAEVVNRIVLWNPYSIADNKDVAELRICIEKVLSDSTVELMVISGIAPTDTTKPIQLEIGFDYNVYMVAVDSSGLSSEKSNIVLVPLARPDAVEGVRVK